MFGLEDLSVPEAQSEQGVGYFMLSLMQVSAQAKIIHWQTPLDTEHRHYGAYYDQFNGLMDDLIEAIAGKLGTQSIKFGQAEIVVADYDQAVPAFFGMVEDCLRIKFREIFDRDDDSELYNIVDEILDLTNKTKYLLQQK